MTSRLRTFQSMPPAAVVAGCIASDSSVKVICRQRAGLIFAGIPAVSLVKRGELEVALLARNPRSDLRQRIRSLLRHAPQLLFSPSFLLLFVLALWLLGADHLSFVTYTRKHWRSSFTKVFTQASIRSSSTWAIVSVESPSADRDDLTDRSGAGYVIMCCTQTLSNCITAAF
jgi:hypothetical protein